VSSVTIVDVAQRVGVSVATISRYLSGLTVRQEEDIRVAIADLKYRPSVTARNLKSGRTGTIAVIVPDISNPFFSAIVQGAESAAGDEYMVLLVNTADSNDREERALGKVFGRVDGVILAPNNEMTKSPNFFSNFGLPIVFVDRLTENSENFDSVLVDNVRGAELATRHLIELGHFKIAIISGPMETTPGKLRVEGYRNALKKAKLRAQPEYFQESDFSQSGGYQAMKALLNLAERPTAVFTANNLMTIGALEAIRESGISIPDDISLIGFDDLDFAHIIEPPLTVISRDVRLQGAKAMEMLLDRLRGNVSFPPQHQMVEVQMIERGSCAAPSFGNSHGLGISSSLKNSNPRSNN
jgi:LacI family transcriptional regulator